MITVCLFALHRPLSGSNPHRSSSVVVAPLDSRTDLEQVKILEKMSSF